MRPEDWLRERGIEVQRGHAGGHGNLASQLTGALPDADGLTPIDQIDTQRIPAVPLAPDLPAGPDISTLPTAHLHDRHMCPTNCRQTCVSCACRPSTTSTTASICGRPR